MKKLVVLWLLFSVTAYADTTYTVHAPDGLFLSELTKSGVEPSNACGIETRNLLYFKLLSRQLVVTVNDESMYLTTQDKRDEAALTFSSGIDAVGHYDWGLNEMTVTIAKWGFGKHQRKELTIEVVRRLPKGDCRESWVTYVSPSINREVLRGD